MRRTILFLLFLVSIAGAIAQSFTIGQLRYTLMVGNEVAVYKADYDISGKLNIPQSVNYVGTQYYVTSIGDHAFYDCSSLTSVTIPNSVTSIGECAFYGCSSLTSVQIPNSVTSIGNVAFYGCSGLTGITIPNSVISIAGFAFSGCSGLTTITIPNSVSSIGDGAFGECSSLTQITVSADNKWYCSEDGILFNKERTTLIEYPQGKIKQQYNIPNSVTSIGNVAFYGCSGLTGITIPNSVTSIGSGAFDGCSSLTQITVSADNKWYCSENGILFNKERTTLIKYPQEKIKQQYNIPNSVTSIERCAFYGCAGLTGITIPNSVTSIGYSAFCGCTSLTSINIPNLVTYIRGSTFKGCNNLASVNIPNSITGIGGEAFYGCAKLKSIDIPGSVTSIERYAFYECSSLTQITDSADNKRYCSEDGILFNKDKSTLIQYPAGKSNKEFNIPNTVTTIGFRAFGGCNNLKSVSIPNSVTTIDSGIFNQCTNLTSVFIGTSVTQLANAFSGCTNLKEIYCQPSTPPSYPRFEEEIYAQATLYVPIESKGEYSTTSPWSNFLNIVAYDFSGVENVLNDANVTISVENGKLKITGLKDNEPIIIYNMAGALIYSGTEHGIPSFVHGIYIVKAGTTITKIVI